MMDIENLNPEVSTQWRMSRTEMLCAGLALHPRRHQEGRVMTRQRYDPYLAEQVEKAVAAERERWEERADRMVAAERERCARIADSFRCGLCGMDGKAAAAIRKGE